MAEKWFYGRVSTVEQQEDRDALKKQLERGKNVGCTRFYWDIQSRTTEVRDGLQRLVDDLKLSSKGAVDQLVVLRLDRIGSSSKLFYNLLEILRSKNIKLVSIDQAIDTETIGGELTIDVLLATSKFEINMISNRVSSERKLRMVQAKSHRFAPFGWKVINDKYVKDDAWVVSIIDGQRQFRAWELTIFIFQLFESCGSVRRTCQELNRMFGTPQNVRSRGHKKFKQNVATVDNLDTIDYRQEIKVNHGKFPFGSLQWSPHGLQNFLVNPVHAGGTGYDVNTRTNKGHRHNHFDNRSVNWGTHEGLITREQHEQVKRIIRGNANNKWAGAIHPNPYANLLKCERCGGAIARVAGSSRRAGKMVHYHQCTYYPLGRCDAKETIRSDRLDEQVIELLVMEATRLAGLVDLGEERTEEPAEVRELRDTLAGLERVPSNPFVDKAIEGVREQIAQLLANQCSTDQHSIMIRDKMMRMFRDREFWDALTLEDKKRILIGLVRKIVVNCDRVVRIELL